MKKKLINIYLCIFAFIILFSQNIKADDLFDQGKKIFLGVGNCGTCHTLQDANSNGNIGPNLNEIRPNITRVLSAIIKGIGVMPAYEGRLYTEKIKAVATYVIESAN